MNYMPNCWLSFFQNAQLLILSGGCWHIFWPTRSWVLCSADFILSERSSLNMSMDLKKVILRTELKRCVQYHELRTTDWCFLWGFVRSNLSKPCSVLNISLLDVLLNLTGRSPRSWRKYRKQRKENTQRNWKKPAKIQMRLVWWRTPSQLSASVV